MKMIFSLIVTTVILFSQTINEQIHALDKASPQERVNLMNSIKKQLISMNEEKRMSTISSLREKLQAKHEETIHEPIQQEDLNEEGFSHGKGNHQNVLRDHSHLEQQEQMMNPIHIKNMEQHRSMQNHREREQQNHVEQESPRRDTTQHESRENRYHNFER